MFADKVKILSLEAKVRELKGKLKDLKPNLIFHDLNVMEGLLKELVQINSSDPKEIDFLKLELKQTNKDLSSKEYIYIIKCMNKGIESSNSIYKQTLDIRSSE